MGEYSMQAALGRERALCPFHPGALAPYDGFMTCEKCANVVERPDLPHVIRACEGCGRLLRIHEPGENGRGFKVQKGDQVVIPAGFIKLSLNPLKSSGQFSHHGLGWFAQQIHLEDLPTKRDEMPAEIERLVACNEDILRRSSLLDGLSLDDTDHADAVFAALEGHRDTIEWWAYLSLVFLSMASDAIEQNDSTAAAWATSCAERCRSMVVFKEHLEEVVWMGQSAKRVIDILRIWDNNRSNANESFWQATFKENAYAVSQVFAVPLVFIKDSAYVGGMGIDRKNAKFVDFLFSVESSREAVLIEIKTPATKLLGKRYRGTYCPSPELVGAVMQVLDYRGTLVKDLRAVVEGTGHDLSAFSPKCAVILGNGTAELADVQKRAAFEHFRANSRDVEIVTFDELFRKIEVLASLFSLTRTAPIGGA